MLNFEHVAKTYRTLLRSTPALHDFHLQVEAGELVGIIGSNGAGKTTLIQLALGYLDPTKGAVYALGQRAGDPETRRQIGWVPDEPIYPAGATARSLLGLWLGGHGLPPADRNRRIEELLKRFGMSHAADRRISTYSLGMQQKTSLMLALSHYPRLLILDEPFSALDHRSLLMVRRALSEFCDNGGAALVSSHHLSELEALCHRAVFLHDGAVEREERLDRGGVTRIHFELANAARAQQLLETSCPGWFDQWEIRERTLLGRLQQREQLADLIALLVNHDVRIESATESTSRLEELYLEVEGGR